MQFVKGKGHLTFLEIFFVQGSVRNKTPFYGQKQWESLVGDGANMGGFRKPFYTDRIDSIEHIFHFDSYSSEPQCVVCE